MTDGPRITVLLPTTGEKGGVIRHAMDSVLNQSVEDIELFVVGDGMGAGTRAVVSDYARRDRRVRVFEFPKQFSRGTPNRHGLLIDEARGDIVCYICDRDLWCRDHLEAVSGALGSSDFAYTQSLIIKPEQVEFGPPLMTLSRDGHRAFFIERVRHTHEFLPLSGVGHTMDMYRRLPHGWRVSTRMATDYYMWLQFLEQPGCRVHTTGVPTLLWFPKSAWGAEETPAKVASLSEWYRRCMNEDWLAGDRWRLAFRELYLRASVFRVRAALAEEELGWPEP